MKRPMIGEQVIVTVSDELYGTLEVGDKVNPAAKGTVVKAS